MDIQKSDTLKFSISGLRGFYAKDLIPKNLLFFSDAFHKVLPGGEIAIARDNRGSGEAIKHIIVGNLIFLGRKVLDLGVLPTPTLKSYVRIKSLAGGIMISASHNPIEYNALKFIKKGGMFFNDKDNVHFINILKHGLARSESKKLGSLVSAGLEAEDLHIQDILKKIPCPEKVKLRIALDTLGGAGTFIAKKFLEKLQADVYSIFPDILPVFPRQPEPNQKSLRKLSDFVRKNKCDIGFGFDPDADRLVVVGSSGLVLGEEYTFPLVALEALKHRRGGIVVNFSSSWLNRWLASQFDRNFYLAKVGEANVLDLMLRKKAELGGEGNGGVIDRQVSSLGRDSISGMAWILSLMHNENRAIDELAQKFPKTYMKKIKFKLTRNLKIHSLKTKLKKEFSGFIVNEEDGFYFSAKEGIPWIHIRSSNTEPVVRIIAEAKEPVALRRLLSFIPDLR